MQINEEGREAGNGLRYFLLFGFPYYPIFFVIVARAYPPP